MDNKNSEIKINENNEKIAMHVSRVSIYINLVLSAAKFFAGIVASSGAMISDAVHSASDVFSTIIVMIGIRISGKDADEEHPYGHDRLECVAAIVLAVVLLITGIWIGYGGLQKIFHGSYDTLTVPGLLALIAAIVSIIVKEGMFWYTRNAAKRISSAALMADAWHHRSDALSSIGSFVGILFARIGFPIMDSIASVVICIFIIKASVDIFKDAIDKMVDKSVDEKIEDEIRQTVLQDDGVLEIDLLHTRTFGSGIYVDLEFSADSTLSLEESHTIAERVHNTIEQKFPNVKHIMIHVNPYHVEHLAM